MCRHVETAHSQALQTGMLLTLAAVKKSLPDAEVRLKKYEFDSAAVQAGVC